MKHRALPTLPTSELEPFLIKNDSSVLANELLSETPVYNVYRGHMPALGGADAGGGGGGLIPVTVKQLRDPKSDDFLIVGPLSVCLCVCERACACLSLTPTPTPTHTHTHTHDRHVTHR